MKMSYEVIGDKSQSAQDYLFKILIIGDTEVGKSCLMKRVMENQFEQDYSATIGVELESLILNINNQVVKL